MIPKLKSVDVAGALDRFYLNNATVVPAVKKDAGDYMTLDDYVIDSRLSIPGPFTEKLAYYLSENMHKGRITAEMAASHFEMSYKQLYQDLNKEGAVFVRVLKNIQYSRAVHLLAYTKEPIRNIAAMLGFNDGGSLSNFFLSKSGLAPKRFRKIYGRDD